MDDFDKNKLFKAVLLCDAALVLLYILSNYVIPIPSWTVKHWFDMNAEQNIPTWFATVQLFSVGVLCFTYARRLNDRILRRFYVLAAAAFAFLSADEASQIHEGIAGIARKSGIFDSYFPDGQLWMLLYPATALILAAMFQREIRAFLRERTGTLILIIGAVIYGIGVIGFESIAVYLIPPGNSLMVFIEVCFEEGFELLGQSIMLYALLVKLGAPVNVGVSASAGRK